jgi:hypothetical protein
MTTDDTRRPRPVGPALTLCRVCLVAAGFWNPADPLCPRCATREEAAPQ